MKAKDKKMLKKVVEIIEDMKGEETLVLDLMKLTTMTDYFIIGSGTNTRQVHAVAKGIEEELHKEFDLKPYHIEGLRSSQWVLLDYGFFIVHIFLDEKRNYYNLEKIWLDAPRVAL
jgi:ribosome-associated protein